MDENSQKCENSWLVVHLGWSQGQALVLPQVYLFKAFSINLYFIPVALPSLCSRQPLKASRPPVPETIQIELQDIHLSLFKVLYTSQIFFIIINSLILSWCLQLILMPGYITFL